MVGDKKWFCIYMSKEQYGDMREGDGNVGSWKIHLEFLSLGIQSPNVRWWARGVLHHLQKARYSSSMKPFSVSGFADRILRVFSGPKLPLGNACDPRWSVRFIARGGLAEWTNWWPYMCQGLNSHYFHIIGDGKINPLVGVYIPIIRIPIKGGMTIPNIATFDHGTYVFPNPKMPKTTTFRDQLT